MPRGHVTQGIVELNAQPKLSKEMTGGCSLGTSRARRFPAGVGASKGVDGNIEFADFETIGGSPAHATLYPPEGTFGLIRELDTLS